MSRRPWDPAPGSVASAALAVVEAWHLMWRRRRVKRALRLMERAAFLVAKDAGDVHSATRIAAVRSVHHLGIAAEAVSGAFLSRWDEHLRWAREDRRALDGEP